MLVEMRLNHGKSFLIVLIEQMEQLSVALVFLWPLFLFGHFLQFCSRTEQTTVNESNVSRVTGESFVTTQL